MKNGAILAMCVLAVSMFLIPLYNRYFRTSSVKKVSLDESLERKDFVSCFHQILPCENDNDCQNKCQPRNVSWTCLNNVCSSPDLGKCVPKGGRGIWTLSNLEHAVSTLGITCVCLHPEIFYGRNCSLISPFVCSGVGKLVESKKMTPEETKKEINGSWNNCVCPPNHVQVDHRVAATNTNVPYCIPETLLPFFKQSNMTTLFAVKTRGETATFPLPKIQVPDDFDELVASLYD